MKFSRNKIVLAPGVFDVLHPGHIQLFKFAKSLGKKLIVGISSDKAVKLLKGPGRPINDEVARKVMLESLKYVDEVVIIDDVKLLDTVKRLKPDILVKGSEWTAEEVRQRDKIPNEVDIKIYKITSEVSDFSTTNTLKKIQGKGYASAYDKKQYDKAVTK